MSTQHQSRHSWPLYVHVVHSLVDGATVGQIAERCKITPNTAHQVIRRFKAQGLAYISRWTQPFVRSVMVAVWRFGAGVDAARPFAKHTGLPYARAPSGAVRVGAETVSFAHLMRALLTGPHSISGLMEYTGAGRTQMESVIRIARALKIIYIAEWEISPSGPPARMYRFGVDTADKARPKAMSRDLIERRYRDGRKAKSEILVMLRALAFRTALQPNAPANV